MSAASPREGRESCLLLVARGWLKRRLFKRFGRRDIPSFIIWSDIHSDKHPFTIPRRDDLPAPDDLAGLLIAGDLSSHDRMAETAAAAVWREWRVPVLCVEGNHDLAGRASRLTIGEIRRSNDEAFAAARAAGADVTLLRGGSGAVIAGVRVVGATLWIDGRLFPESPPGATEAAMDARMSELRMLWADGLDGPRLAQAADLFREHERDVAGLRVAFRQPFTGPTILMTHYPPLRRLMSAGGPMTLEDAAYGSELPDLVRELAPDWWIFGHTHRGVNADFAAGERVVRFRTNPRGYPRDGAVFQPCALISA